MTPVTTLGPVRRVLRSDFVRHGLLVFASTSLVNLFNYFFHFFMSRRLGVVDYGALASIFAGLVIVSVPSAIVTMVVVRYAAEFKAVGDTPRLRTLGDRVLFWTTLVGLAALAACAVLRDPIARYLNIDDARAVAVAGSVLALAFVVPAVRGVVQGAQDFRRLAVSTAMDACGKLVFGIGLVLAGFGLVGAILGFACGSLISLLYTIGVVRSYAPPTPARLRIDVRRLLITTRGVALSTFALTSMGFADVLLVKHFFSPHVAGLYGAISLVGKVLLFVVGFVPTVVLPKATARATSGQPVMPILLQAFGATLLISGAGLAVIAVAPQVVLRLMAGGAFAAAAPYVFSYAVAMTLLAALSLVTTYQIGLARFSFVPLLVTVAAGEIVAIQFFHADIRQVINILLTGHGIALLGCLLTVPRPLAVAAPVPAQEVA
jgi:O-antigen/teichoic acid export membrane protein